MMTKTEIFETIDQLDPLKKLQLGASFLASFANNEKLYKIYEKLGTEVDKGLLYELNELMSVDTIERFIRKDVIFVSVDSIEKRNTRQDVIVQVSTKLLAITNDFKVSMETIQALLNLYLNETSYEANIANALKEVTTVLEGIRWEIAEAKDSCNHSNEKYQGGDTFTCLDCGYTWENYPPEK
jgi:rubrerythrin